MITRRGLLAALAGLPLVGRWLKADEPKWPEGRYIVTHKGPFTPATLFESAGIHAQRAEILGYAHAPEGGDGRRVRVNINIMPTGIPLWWTIIDKSGNPLRNSIGEYDGFWLNGVGFVPDDIGRTIVVSAGWSRRGAPPYNYDC